MLARRAKETDLEWIRQLRNSCREQFTRHTEEISQEQQLKWWETHPLLYVLEDWPYESSYDNIGYALLTPSNGSYWISLAVKPEYRGMGAGATIYRHFKGLAVAEIRDTNDASIAAAEKAGYRRFASTQTGFGWYA